MSTTLKIKANDIDESFISQLKKEFKDKKILISEVGNIEELLESLQNAENNIKTKSFSIEEFEKYSDEKR